MARTDSSERDDPIDRRAPGEVAPPPEPGGSAPFSTRRGWSAMRRLREPDSFGVLLLLIVLTLFGVALGGSTVVGTAIATALAAAVFVFALRTSVAPKRLERAMALTAPLLVLASLLSHVSTSKVAEMTAPAATALLVLGALVAVARRLIAHPEVGGRTILGAVCVYLLLGLLFASVYAVFGAVGQTFVQQATTSAVDVIYFSFITLATVGFGDLTPKTDVLRMVAVVEALLGQLYLVTIISVLVSNVGTRRSG